MASKVFINLPVKDLERSKAFFARLGYSFNEKFTDSSAACMVISEHIYSMLLSEARFKDFTPKAVADATKSTEVLVALAVESKAKVDEMVDTALKAGATKTREPQDHGFMYERSFNDLDGHIWEIFWMDPAAAQ
jgi:predicted lactoylglutathione lyase